MLISHSESQHSCLGYHDAIFEESGIVLLVHIRHPIEDIIHTADAIVIVATHGGHFATQLQFACPKRMFGNKSRGKEVALVLGHRLHGAHTRHSLLVDMIVVLVTLRVVIHIGVNTPFAYLSVVICIHK